MLIKPAPGLKIRDPRTKLHLPAEGAEMRENISFWTRRLQCGDVVLVSSETEKVEAPAAAPAPEKKKK